jgi:IclR family transcriptional regulator, KDG regulon repressor
MQSPPQPSARAPAPPAATDSGSRPIPPPVGQAHAGVPSAANQSITSAARVLGELAAARQPLGVTELARRLGESKARVFRHLATLRQVGFVAQESGGDRYQLGWNLYRLGIAAGEQCGLEPVARRHLAQLRDCTQETTAMAVPAGGDALVMGSVASERQVAIAIKLGVVIAANYSALGRVLLAFAEPAVQQQVLARKMVARNAQSITEPTRLRERLVQIRERWWEVAINENNFGIATLAAPVFDAQDRPCAAVAIVGSSLRIAEPPEAQLLEQVQGCAESISAELGSQAWARWRAGAGASAP